MTFRQLGVVSALLLLVVGCADKDEIQRLTQERETDRIVFEKVTRRLLQDVASAEKRLAEQRAEFGKEGKTAQDKFAAQERELAVLRARRLPTQDEIILAKADISTLKICAMQGVTSMARAGDWQRAETFAAFLVKALKGDEDVIKLKEGITAQRAAAEKNAPEKP